ncbi:hypothetical protein B566_EDAN010596 [Ephemera danica]|nr:hypothetical protein B566_EDAN010596 [Ephemera danica]
MFAELTLIMARSRDWDELQYVWFDVEDAWEQVKPLYVQLHTYVRRKLRDHYGPEKIHRRAPIAAHILGKINS